MKDWEFHTVQDVHRRPTEIWNGLNFKDVQSVPLEWKIRLNWVIENGGEEYDERNKQNGDFLGAHFQGILSARLSGHPVYACPHLDALLSPMTSRAIWGKCDEHGQRAKDRNDWLGWPM
jgi:hypothetical protein